MDPRPTDTWPTKALSQINQAPIGVAKFQEPIFRRGRFQNQYIEVQVTVYPVSAKHPQTKKEMVAVRFGQMNVVRFIERDLLYDLEINQNRT